VRSGLRKPQLRKMSGESDACRQRWVPVTGTSV